MKGGPIEIHTDGGARGNPGPAAAAFLAEKDGKLLYKDSKFLGKVTNNVAEYTAVKLAINWLIEKEFIETAVFFLDSELIVRQINGVYKVKDENLKKIFLEIKETLAKLKQEISFKYVPREKNKIADLLVNEELDKGR